MCIFIARYITRGANLKRDEKSFNAGNGKPIKIGNKVFYEDNSGNWIF